MAIEETALKLTPNLHFNKAGLRSRRGFFLIRTKCRRIVSVWNQISRFGYFSPVSEGELKKKSSFAHLFLFWPMKCIQHQGLEPRVLYSSAG